MTANETPTGRTRHHRRTGARARRRIALALTAVAALTVTACGTQQSGAGKEGAARDTSAGSARAEPAAAAPRTTDSGELPDGDAVELAFMEKDLELTELCSPVPPGGRKQQEKERAAAAAEERAAEEEPRSGPEEPLPEEGQPVPLDDTVPVPDPPRSEPGTTPAVGDVELTEVEKCVGDAHARRVTGPVTGLGPAASPEQVKAELRGLGYPGHRIHGPVRSGETTRYWLDLRIMGGRLALEISSAGPKVRATPQGVFENGPFVVPGLPRK
ncbi:hypothetical protein ACWDR0_03690 [Streptomyces sp. NPDC003691]